MSLTLTWIRNKYRLNGVKVTVIGTWASGLVQSSSLSSMLEGSDDGRFGKDVRKIKVRRCTRGYWWWGICFLQLRNEIIEKQMWSMNWHIRCLHSFKELHCSRINWPWFTCLFSLCSFVVWKKKKWQTCSSAVPFRNNCFLFAGQTAALVLKSRAVFITSLMHAQLTHPLNR